MRRTVGIILVATTFLFFGGSAFVSAATTTTVPVATTVVGETTTSTTSTSSTTSTTTTTLPSAVTTVPEGCPLPPVAQAVFVAVAKKVDTVAVQFTVSQVRAGSLEGYIANNTVTVRYGADAKYINEGSPYIVGVSLDPVTLTLSSTVRDAAEIFGGAEVVGSNVQCPKFDAAARTIHTDGSSISSGLFNKFFDQPLRLLAVLLLPSLLVVMALVGLVWFRRGTKR